MGGRRFVEGLYRAPFSFRLAGWNVIYKRETKIEPDLELESPDFRFPKVWVQEQYYIDLASAKSEAPINSNL